MRAWILALGVASGCGRFDFDSHSGSPDDAALPDTFDPGATAADFVAAMPCETDIPVATVPQVDELQWLDLGARQVVFAIYHVNNTHHQIHAIVLGTYLGQVVKIADVLEYAVADLSGLVVARTSAGELVFVHDVAGNMVHALAFDANLAAIGDTPLPGLEDSFEAYAKSNTAQMIAGATASGVVAFTIDDTGAMTSGSFVIDTIADGPFHTSIKPFGNDFIVGWTTSANNCRVVRIDATGAVLAGPLVIAGPSTGCTFASAASIGASIFITFEDPAGPAYVVMTDSTLATASAPVVLGADPSFVQEAVADTDHLVVAVSENMGDSRIVSVATTGAVTPLGTDFGLTANSTDHQTASLVAGALVHARSEGGVLRVRKLCR